MMTVLLALYCSVILTACANIKANGGVQPDAAIVPVGKPLMESQVAGYVEDLRSETQQCNANFLN